MKMKPRLQVEWQESKAEKFDLPGRRYATLSVVVNGYYGSIPRGAKYDERAVSVGMMHLEATFSVFERSLYSDYPDCLEAVELAHVPHQGWAIVEDVTREESLRTVAARFTEAVEAAWSDATMELLEPYKAEVELTQ
jgi:hypothetical protein